LDRKSLRALSQALVFSFALVVLAGIAVFAGFLPKSERLGDDAFFEGPELAFEQAAYAAIEGWSVDDQFAALETFVRSCARIEAGDPAARANPKEAAGVDFRGAGVSGLIADWTPPCFAARRLIETAPGDPADRSAAARGFFEQEFTPLRVLAKRRPKSDAPLHPMAPRFTRLGLATGYFEPVYAASLASSAQRPAPALARPHDLVTVDLGEFRESLAGDRIAGYVEDGRLRPYPDRRAINRGALGSRAVPLAYLDPNDLFFLQIQGSGRLKLDDGRELRLGFDGQNGRPYTPVGRVLIERGALTRESVSMQTIRGWLARAAPDEAEALRNVNESYVFFRPLDDLPEAGLGPLGAQGVQLTGMRSLAVDRRFHAFGAPMFVRIAPKDGGGPEIERLFIAQDEGGAIKGPIRADLFVGAGAEAGEIAGRLNAEIELYALLPNAVARRLPAAAVRR
jgi:membrane-bound lytic murein transglycosylase A